MGQCSGRCRHKLLCAPAPVGEKLGRFAMMPRLPSLFPLCPPACHPQCLEKAHADALSKGLDERKLVVGECHGARRGMWHTG